MVSSSSLALGRACSSCAFYGSNDVKLNKAYASTRVNKSVASSSALSSNTFSMSLILVLMSMMFLGFFPFFTYLNVINRGFGRMRVHFLVLLYQNLNHHYFEFNCSFDILMMATSGEISFTPSEASGNGSIASLVIFISPWLCCVTSCCKGTLSYKDIDVISTMGAKVSSFFFSCVERNYPSCVAPSTFSDSLLCSNFEEVREGVFNHPTVCRICSNVRRFNISLLSWGSSLFGVHSNLSTSTVSNLNCISLPSVAKFHYLLTHMLELLGKVFQTGLIFFGFSFGASNL